MNGRIHEINDYDNAREILFLGHGYPFLDLGTCRKRIYNLTFPDVCHLATRVGGFHFVSSGFHLTYII